MPRASYTDDQVLAAARGNAADGIPAPTASRWRREAEEWETELVQAAQQKRDPEPTSRVARLLLAAALPVAVSADTDVALDEGSFVARARTREALTREDLQAHLSGRLLQVIDYDVERLDELNPGQRRELAKFLATEVRRLDPPVPEAGETAGANPMVALFQHITQSS